MKLSTGILFAALLGFSINEAYGRDETTLLYNLFTLYDKRVIPSLNITSENSDGENFTIPTVHMAITLSNIKHVDLNKNKASLTVWKKMIWTDPRLKWNPESYGGIQLLRINMDDIWIPDVVLYNGKEVQNMKPNGLLSNTGEVYYLPPYDVEVVSDLAGAASFPYDNHVITLKYGSWTYDGTLLDVALGRGIDEIDMEDYLENAVWDVTGSSAVRSAVKYSCCDEIYIDLKFKIDITRKPSFICASLLAPSVLTSICLVFIFALPPACSEKMTLAIAILLGILLLNYMHYTIIGISTMLGDYLLFGLVLTVLVIGETVLVYNLFHRFGKVPELIRKLFVDWLSHIVCVSPPGPGSHDVEMEQNANADEKTTQEKCEKPQGNNQDWITIAKVIDRLCFWIFVFTYTVGSAVLLSRRN